MKTGVEIIALERARQIEVEKWTAEHDDRHSPGNLSQAGACYAVAASIELMRGLNASDIKVAPPQWPWDQEWWKPSSDPIRNLAKAGALIAAEIDRIQRRLS